MKFRQVIEYKKINSLSKNQSQNQARRLVSDPFLFLKYAL